MEHIPIPRVGKAIQNEIIAMTEPLICGMGKEAAETCQKRLELYKKTKIKVLNRNKDKLKALNYKIDA